MSEARKKRKVEFIESYWTGGEYGSNYEWNDNHGELVRCADCRHYRKDTCSAGAGMAFPPPDDWFCADGERK